MSRLLQKRARFQEPAPALRTSGLDARACPGSGCLGTDREVVQIRESRHGGRQFGPMGQQL